MNRYARHTVLKWFGTDGQNRLGKSAVLVVGCGGTGCACSAFLAGAGVGKIIVADRDVVGLTDLHRQILYTEADAEHLTPKAVAAAYRLRAANGEIDVEAVVEEFSPRNASVLAGQVDLIVDCSDNFETRMLINDVCLKGSLPWVHGACTGTTGMVIPFPAGAEVCYRCVVDRVPAGRPSPGGAPGVLGPAAGTVGCVEACEAVKLLVAPESVRSRIMYFDCLSYAYETIGVHRKKDCPACAGGRYEYLDKAFVPQESMDGESRTARLLLPVRPDRARLRERPAEDRAVTEVGDALRVTTADAEFLLLPDGTAVVRGVGDLEEARSLLDDLVEG